MTGYDSGRVAPFRNPRIKGCLAPPRGLSQPATSFFAFRRQGIHLPPLLPCYFSLLFPYAIVKEQQLKSHCQAHAWVATTIPIAAAAIHATSKNTCEIPHQLVEVNGIEPMTSSLQSSRSPN